MFDFRDNRNRIFDRELEVSYAIEKIDYTDSGVAGSWYRVTRNAALSYHYIDLSPAAAGDIAQQLRALYTRTTAALGRRESGATIPQVVTYPERLTSVAIERGVGQVYSVNVKVNERDVRPSATLPAVPSSLFTAENARDYDGLSIRDSLDAVSASVS